MDTHIVTVSLVTFLWHHKGLISRIRKRKKNYILADLIHEECDVTRLVYSPAEKQLREICLLCLQSEKKNKKKLTTVCALYFNVFVIYNCCIYTKTEGKLSLCTLVNNNKKKI